ncbi:MAG: glycine cleavage system aminomethyltransferase GcvT [Sporichthyaceae bacterium]
MTLRRSPLYDRHVALGAKLADFGGWEMPIDYGAAPSKLGVVAEHTAVRSSVGLFDVSHLGKASVVGPGAAAFVDACLTNSLAKIGPGQAQYSLCCTADGGIVDDLIVYLRADDDVFLVPNAANTAEVVRRLAAVAPPELTVTDEHEAYAVLAVQGPRAEEILGKLGLPVGHPYMSFRFGAFEGAPVTVCRSGYTGELGYEVLPRWDDAPALWDAIAALGVTPVGLGARDTLRTEMGYPLHGQDISQDVTPPQANLSWAVGWDKPGFWGRENLLEQKAAGRTRRLVGLLGDARTIPRAHMAVSREPGGPVIGEVTSGTFSPTRKCGIGMALVDTTVADGDTLAVDIRGRVGTFEVVKPPFVDSHVK